MTPEFYCFTTGTLVERNRMRPGYDCKCTGCMAWLKSQRERGTHE